MRLLRLPLILIFILTSLLRLANAADFHAKVIHITDGDTITILNNTNKQLKTRLNGIDSPEKAQAFGNKAKQFTKNLVDGQTVPVCEKAQEC
jgi:endonuclease YncB( thermonuclease family)